jgi:hypothetical protein
MNPQTYSREALRVMPVGARKGFLKITIDPLVNRILGAAKNGQTSLLLDSSIIFEDKLQMKSQLYRNLGQPVPTVEEIREALLEQFPDSSIVYEEKWVQTSPAKQEMKKGLFVDWS